MMLFALTSLSGCFHGNGKGIHIWKCFPKSVAPITEILWCLLQGTENVKQADAGASAAGKEIGASAHQHQPNTVSIPRAKCAVEEAHVYVASASALTPGASAASVNTAPRVT